MRNEHSFEGALKLSLSCQQEIDAHYRKRWDEEMIRIVGLEAELQKMDEIEHLILVGVDDSAPISMMV